MLRNPPIYNYERFTETEIFIQYIKIASFIFLLFSIFIFEIAYKKDNDEISLNGIEFLVLSIFSLLIQYIPKLLKIDENTYMLAGTYIFLIYYGIKNIKEKSYYLTQLETQWESR